MLDRLTVDSFAPLVGDTFVLRHDEGVLDLKLVDAALVRPAGEATDESGRRRPFSVVFEGPAEPILPQRIHRIEHESLGPLEIFIVPIAGGPAGTRYEASFA